MFGLRSAQSRAIASGTLLLLVLAGITTVAVWRAYDDQQRHHGMEHTSTAATALEHAHAQFWRAQATLSALILIDDPSLADAYHDTVASLEQNLSQARTQTLAAGETDHVAALDALAERIGHFTAQVDLALPVVLEADTETRVQLAASSMSRMVSEAEAIIADLEALVDEEQQELAATRAAADRAADTTLWLLVGFSVAAFMVAAGTVAMLIVWLVRPLAALRASATAITAGDPEARARVYGPEEVASLARGFNAMTDALAAKTQELQVRAITDSLTGLYNHAHFFQRLAEEIERSKRHNHGFSIVMMDVDNFKQYNDSRGHQAGDETLRLIADCIRKAIRCSDIAFRYGGDEFAAILLQANSSRTQTIAKRINGHIAARLKEMNDPAAAWLGISAGVACFPNDGTTADELVRVADAALYDAKRVASARRLTGQAQAIEPVASPSETPDEKQPTVLSAAARELAATLQELGVPDALADLDLRTVAAVATAAEIKDPYIRDHQQRVSLWAAALAEEMGLPPKRVRDIRVAGLLHDIGKVSVSEGILNKPGKLTKEEYAQIKEHSTLGAMVVGHIEGLQRLVPIVRHHHERFDGKGYPDGLAGEEIPLQARILAVVDVFDAMTHERSYRKAQTRDHAIAELERGAGTQFDPAVVEAFLALMKRRGEEPPAPAQAASEDKQLAAARAPGRGKG